MITFKETMTVTKTVELEQEARTELYALYQKIWCESSYNPSNEETRKFAQELLPHIQALNKLWRFKE